MSTVEIALDKSGICPDIDRDKWNLSPNSYRCHLLLVKEDEGDWSAIILNLPGAGSCGSTETEAVANAREAVVGVIRSYLDDGEDIPWTDSRESVIPDEAKQKWILVHA